MSTLPPLGSRESGGWLLDDHPPLNPGASLSIHSEVHVSDQRRSFLALAAPCNSLVTDDEQNHAACQGRPR